MTEALSLQQTANVSCLPFSVDDRQFIKQTLDSLCCFLGLSHRARHSENYVKMELMFGKPPSLQGLLRHPEKIGQLILALCKDLGNNENMKNTPYFRLILRKIVYEAHPFFRDNIDTILPLMKESE